MCASRPAFATALGLWLGLGPACSVADLTSGAPLDAGDHDAASGGDALDAALMAPTTQVGLKNLQNGRFLEVPGQSTTNGGPVVTSSYAGVIDQLWIFRAEEGGTYEIVNWNSGDCLQAPNGETGNGTPMQQWMCLGGPNQLWKLVGLYGHLQLIGQQSGRCLASLTDRDDAGVYVWDCYDDLSELWEIAE